MSYYRTLEVLALCDAIDKVPSIRQTLEQDNGSESRKHSITYSLDTKKLKIPKVSQPLPQHDLLELDSIFKDKPKSTIPKNYNDDAIRNSILSSSEAATTIQRNGVLHGLNVPIAKPPAYNSSDRPMYTPPTSSSIHSVTLQQQTKSLQAKKSLQNQHFQSSSNRLSSLNLSSPSMARPMGNTSGYTLSTPTAQRSLNYNYQNQDSNQRFPELSQRLNSAPQQHNLTTPSTSPPPYSQGYPHSNDSSRPSTPGGGRRTPHNAGFTTMDDGLEEVCEHCQRIFRGPKSSTHKQQHIKRIHPEDYVRKKGGIKRQHAQFTVNNF